MEIKDNCPHCGDGFSIDVLSRTKVICTTCRRNFFVSPDGKNTGEDLSLSVDALSELLLPAKRDLAEYLSALKKGWSVSEGALAITKERVERLIEEIKG